MFSKLVGSKMKNKGCIGPVMNMEGKLIMGGIEEVLNLEYEKNIH